MKAKTLLSMSLMTASLLSVSTFATASSTLSAQQALLTNHNGLSSQFYVEALDLAEHHVVESDKGLVSAQNVLTSKDFVRSLPASEKQFLSPVWSDIENPSFTASGR